MYKTQLERLAWREKTRFCEILSFVWDIDLQMLIEYRKFFGCKKIMALLEVYLH